MRTTMHARIHLVCACVCLRTPRCAGTGVHLSSCSCSIGAASDLAVVSSAADTERCGDTCRDGIDRCMYACIFSCTRCPCCWPLVCSMSKQLHLSSCIYTKWCRRPFPLALLVAALPLTLVSITISKHGLPVALLHCCRVSTRPHTRRHLDM